MNKIALYTDTQMIFEVQIETTYSVSLAETSHRIRRVLEGKAEEHGDRIPIFYPVDMKETADGTICHSSAVSLFEFAFYDKIVLIPPDTTSFAIPFGTERIVMELRPLVSTRMRSGIGIVKNRVLYLCSEQGSA